MKNILVLLALFLACQCSALATTCVWDGYDLASDSRMTSGTTIVSDSHQKIFYVKKIGVYVCGTGNVSEMSKFLAFLMYGSKVRIDWDSFEALVIYEDGTAMLWENGAPLSVEAPYAIGSGSRVALGAIACGASAAEAVAVAETLDIATGGPIQVVHIVHHLEKK
jgi:hypothetical protein